MRKIFESHSEEDTINIGFGLGKKLVPPMVVYFYGELGTGKTVLIRGCCNALGVDRKVVRSPSFTLINEYRGIYKIFHIDLYRLNSLNDALDVGIDEVLCSDSIVFVEWAEKLKDFFVPNVEIYLSHVGGNNRSIIINDFTMELDL